MLRLIIKNLWARRRRNGWLFLELVAVAVVSWVILDVVVVTAYVRTLPMGYDEGRLVKVSMAKVSANDPAYVDGADTTMLEDIQRLTRLARALEGVQRATPLVGFAYPGSNGSSNTVYHNAADTLKEAQMSLMYYLPHTDFFPAFGIKAAEGYDIETIEDRNATENDIIMTSDGVEYLFGNDRSRMEVGNSNHRDFDDQSPKYVRGIVEPIKMADYIRPRPVAFLSLDMEELEFFGISNSRYYSVLVRVADGMSTDRFIDLFNQKYLTQFRSGNLYARGVDKYEDIIGENGANKADEIRTDWVLAAFFLINLCLGTIGTFWLQTKVRKQDVGVMLSFGATPARIRRMLLGEGAVLCTLAVAVGCFIYLQWAWSEGVYVELDWGDTPMLMPSWIDNFWQHFLVVSGIIWLIMLAVVLIGIYIPARSISRVNPVEALRDE